MNNLKMFKDFSVNEGMITRGFLKTLFAVVITLGNIKRFFKGRDRESYKMGTIVSNILDFMLTIKRNPDIIEFYEGNYFDEYKKLHGSDIRDDITYLKELLNKDVEEVDSAIKKAKIRNMISKLDEIYDIVDEFDNMGIEKKLLKAGFERGATPTRY